MTADTIGSAIVIRRGSNQLFFYNSLSLERTFHVATGESRYPTPLGRFEVAVKWRDPWWYPPPSDWAKDAKPIPPGPGNPLGTRWMGLTAPYVGIHGTPDAASIGYSVSHGCIRMLIPEVEWLFEQVDVGTPVFVVAAPDARRSQWPAARSSWARRSPSGSWPRCSACSSGRSSRTRPAAIWPSESRAASGRRRRRFRLDRLDREGAVSLASLRGKAVVLNFWASWCIPCKEEAPLLEQAWRDHRAKGLVVLGVDAQDFKGDARSFMKRFGITYPVVHDGKGSTLGRFGVTGFPETFFIDRTGNVVAVEVGPFDERNEDEFADKIALALQES